MARNYVRKNNCDTVSPAGGRMRLNPRKVALSSASRNTTDIFDILRLGRDNSTSEYYRTAFVIFEFH